MCETQRTSEKNLWYLKIFKEQNHLETLIKYKKTLWTVRIAHCCLLKVHKIVYLIIFCLFNQATQTNSIETGKLLNAFYNYILEHLSNICMLI